MPEFVEVCGDFVARLRRTGPDPVRGGGKKAARAARNSPKKFRPDTGTGSGRTGPAGPGEPNPGPTNRSADRAYDTIVP